MNAVAARNRLRAIENELPALLRDAYPEWRITDTGEGFRASRRRPNPRSASFPGAPPCAITTATAAELWSALDLADALQLTRPARPPNPCAKAVTHGRAGP